MASKEAGTASDALALLPLGMTKLRTLHVKARSDDGPTDVVVVGCLERRRGSSRYGRFAVLATDGASVWAATVDDRSHKADNQSCRRLSRQAWVDRIMSTLEACESGTAGPARASPPGVLEAVLKGSREAGDAELRLRVAEHNSVTEPQQEAAASSASTVSSAGAARRVFLSTFITLSGLGAKDGARALRALAGTRLALANKTARAVRQRQTQLESDAARAADLAGQASSRAAAERRSVVATAVALVNAKKARLAELQDRAEEAEKQVQRYEDERKGLEGIIAQLRAAARRDGEELLRLRAEGGGQGAAPQGVQRATGADGTPSAPRRRKRGRDGGACPDGSDTDPDDVDTSSGEEESEEEDHGEAEERAPDAGLAGASGQGQKRARRSGGQASAGATLDDDDSNELDSPGGAGGAAAVHGVLAAVTRRQRARRAARREAPDAMAPAERLILSGSMTLEPSEPSPGQRSQRSRPDPPRQPSRAESEDSLQ